MTQCLSKAFSSKQHTTYKTLHELSLTPQSQKGKLNIASLYSVLVLLGIATLLLKGNKKCFAAEKYFDLICNCTKKFTET